MGMTSTVIQYIKGQVSRDRDIIYGRYGDTPMTGPINIPAEVRKYEGRGTNLTYASRPTEWAPVNILRHPGLTVNDLTLADQSEDQVAYGRPGLFAFQCRDLTISNLRVQGFSPCAVFRQCENLVLNQCHFERAGSWNVFLHDCKNVVINQGTSNLAWLDGIKSAGSTHVTINQMRWDDNGISADTNPKSNGNGIDTYTQTRHLTLNGCGGSRNRGAVVNIKTGPKDFGQPSHDIVVKDVWGYDNHGPLVDVNSTAAISKHKPGDPDPRSPYNITIDGVRGRNNGTGEGGHNRTVRLGHVDNALLTGLWSHDGEVYVTDESTGVIRNQHEVKP